LSLQAAVAVQLILMLVAVEEEVDYLVETPLFLLRPLTQ
jgi:hypothetical protein